MPRIGVLRCLRAGDARRLPSRQLCTCWSCCQGRAGAHCRRRARGPCAARRAPFWREVASLADPRLRAARPSPSSLSSVDENMRLTTVHHRQRRPLPPPPRPPLPDPSSALTNSCTRPPRARSSPSPPRPPTTSCGTRPRPTAPRRAQSTRTRAAASRASRAGSAARRPCPRRRRTTRARPTRRTTACLGSRAT